VLPLGIVKIPCGMLEPYWSEELDRLKKDFINWHRLWMSAGRPEAGWLHAIKSLCKLIYKFAITESYLSYENKLNDDLGEHFINKKSPEFWKVWNAKFKLNILTLLVVLT
jgi:hypothetical protein